MTETRIFAVLSDDPNVLLGISKAKIIGGSDYIGCVVSSTPKLSSAIKERVVDIPLKRIITLCPNNSEEFTTHLLSELSLRGVTDIVYSDYPYKISEEFLEKFPGSIFIPRDTNLKPSEAFIERYVLLTPEMLHQQSSNSRADLTDRDIA